jgi:hypothetical protein
MAENRTLLVAPPEAKRFLPGANSFSLGSKRVKAAAHPCAAAYAHSLPCGRNWFG